MIPIVQTQSLRGENQKIDRRKTRTVSWLEARLCLAREKDSSEPIFGATLGSVDEAGEQLTDIAIRAGIGSGTSVHGVGDGAPQNPLSWLQQQKERLK